MKKRLVMLHGFGCDSRVFASIGTKLSKDYDVWMVDIPGHGQTKEDFRSFHYSAYTILHALEGHLKSPYALLGWSMGGQIALEMHEQDPKLIESLILVSSTPKFVASEDFEKGMNKAVFNKFRKGLKENLEKTMSDFYSLMFSDNENGSLYLSNLQSQTPSQITLMDSMDSFEKYDERKFLPKISVPTLIITGDKDKVIDYKASVFMSKEIKGSMVRILKGAGHAPHLTRERELIDEISKFIG
jgi:pimeloyl-[acyl-carrier protein] methyl ester esterase